MGIYDQNLHISDEAFEKMRIDTDTTLQRLLKNMVDKESLEGKLTITIDVNLSQEFIPNKDPNIVGDTRRVLKPKFSHKVGSVMQIKNETKGDTNYDSMEIVFDEESGEFIMKPIANTDQMTVFDADFQVVNDPEDGENVAEYGQAALEGRKVAALPGSVSEDVGESEDMSGEFEKEDPPPFGSEDSESDKDEYNYEDPE